ncbi:DUF1836 domain-containing protein [Streptococcus suis]|uniref:DUF1836 domain-containing protein n=1 Tax=Streptococcus suivaginalis TaxID=3028082 RepID=A0AA96VF13_9STRE|nr:DUF1836 domain-containing protein [Streptococcus sp. 29896]MCK4027119.1 DUF1836 domain-containing protein [Streptococcus suis]WNY47683.1 DUF1836 domain-containing protein [Streptococcus sp. 29896]
MINLPTWEQLPTLDLYLDQVLLYVNQQTSSAISLKEKPLTAAMINNYVKHGYLPKPIKKKYGQRQLARLLVVTICKPIFPIASIHAVIEQLGKEMDSQALYDSFVASLTGKSAPVHPLIDKVCQTILAYQEAINLAESYLGGPHEPKL